MKKRMVLGVAFLTSCLFLSACGNSAGGTDSSVKAKTKKGEISFVETAKTDSETLWYRVYNVSEQSQVEENNSIDSIVVTKNGKRVLYETKEALTFKDLDGLSDQEIIKKAIELDQLVFEDRLNKVRNQFNEMLEKANKELEFQIEYKDDVINGDPDILTSLEENIPKLEEDINALNDFEYTDPEEKAVEAYVTTKNRQTITETMDIPKRWYYYDDWYYDGISKKLSKVSDEGNYYGEEEFRTVDLIHPVATTKILDKFYSGYINENMNVLFITKVDSENQKVILDKVGTEGVIEK